MGLRRGLRRVKRFLKKPLFLSEEGKRGIVLDSEDYQAIEEVLKLKDEKIWAEGSKAIVENASLGLEVDRLSKIVRELEEGRVGLEERLEEGRELIQEGRVLHDLSKVGILSVDRDNRVVRVNTKACDYLDVDKRELIGIGLGEIVPSEGYLHNYFDFFCKQSKRTGIAGDKIREGTFKIGEVGFDVQGFYNPLKDNEYQGGYVFLTPHKQASMLEQIFGKRSVLVAPTEPLTRGNLAALCPLVEDVKSKEVNLAASSADQEALAHLANHYACFNRGKFVFSGLSEYEKNKLIELGVEEKDILGLRKSQEETGQYPAVSSSGV